MKLYENDCPNCGHIIVREEPDHECPDCGAYMHYTAFTECVCGEKVYLEKFTNICPCCDEMYNMSGTRLAPVSEWDLEDVYACFGPQ